MPKKIKSRVPRKAKAGKTTKDLDLTLRKLKVAKLRMQIAVERGRYILKDFVDRYWRKHITDARILLETLPEALALLTPELVTCPHCRKQLPLNLRSTHLSEGKKILDDCLRSLSEGKDHEES